MVVTVFEARVEAARAQDLRQAYEDGIGELDPGIVETFLLHDARDDSLWRILTVWAGRDALDAMRATGQPPRGVTFFRAAGAEPTLSISDVIAHATTTP